MDVKLRLSWYWHQVCTQNLHALTYVPVTQSPVTKGATTKSFFPKIPDRLKMRISVTPNFTTMITGHGNIKNICTNIKY